MPARTDPLTLTARWVLTAAGPPLAHGTVTVAAGVVTRVDAAGVVAPTLDLGAAAILPGFVNAHTHLDLSGAAGLTPPDPAEPFPAWLARVIAFRRSRTPDEVAADVRRGVDELVRTGTTTVGDISADGGSLPVLAADGRVRAVVFRELIGVAPARAGAALAAARDWLGASPRTGRVRAGLSPHAPYSAGRDLVQGAAALAHEFGVPVCMHVAESTVEGELLARHAGPFVAFLESVGAWHPASLAANYDEVLTDLSAAPRVLVAHGNFLADPPAGATVVYCPRTHAAFGHPPHPVTDSLARGGRVCLGTDSLASNPDLDLLAEARFLFTARPDIPGETLLALLTKSGAEALGLADECGTLEPGKAADLVAVPVDATDPDPYRAVFGRATPGRRWVMTREDLATDEHR